MKAIGVDIGTTTLSSVVMDTDEKKVLESKTIQNGSFIKTAEEWARIQDTAILMKKAKEILDEQLEHHADVAAIGLTGQMHGILYLDGEGQGISPLYTWQDGSGDLPEFDGESVVSQITEKYGIPAATGYGLVTCLYHHKKGMLPKESVSLCTISDYFGMYLTGRKKPLIHASNAASLGFYDTKNRAFRTDLIEAAGIDLSMLPEVTDEVAVLGTYRGIPVTVGLGDNQASFLGSVGLRDNVWQINVGTGGQLSVLSEHHFEAPGIEARPFLDKKYILTGAILCAGRAYAILERFFRSFAAAMGAGEQEQYSVMAKLAEAAAFDANGLRAVTKFKGTRLDPDIRGSISGISEENFLPGNLIISVDRGIAQEYYDIYQEINQGTGIRAEKLLASGNGARRNKVLQRMLQEMFRAELELTAFEEEAACGAAYSTAFSTEL